MIVGVVLGVLALLVGVGFAVREVAQHEQLQEHEDDKSGWVYFVGGKETPIKIGMSQYEPSQQRLPELKTMSPEPLTILFKFFTNDRFNAEKVLHDQLAEHRLHGEWFDRDVCLYYIDHLRGAC